MALPIGTVGIGSRSAYARISTLTIGVIHVHLLGAFDCTISWISLGLYHVGCPHFVSYIIPRNIARWVFCVWFRNTRTCVRTHYSRTIGLVFFVASVPNCVQCTPCLHKPSSPGIVMNALTSCILSVTSYNY